MTTNLLRGAKYLLFCILKNLTFGIINRKSMIVNGEGNPGRGMGPSSIQCTTFIACCDALRLQAIRIDLNLHVIYLLPPPLHVNYMHDDHKGGEDTVSYAHIFQINFDFVIFFSYLFIYFRFEFFFLFPGQPPYLLSSHIRLSFSLLWVCIYMYFIHIETYGRREREDSYDRRISRR